MDTFTQAYVECMLWSTTAKGLLVSRVLGIRS